MADRAGYEHRFVSPWIPDEMAKQLPLSSFQKLG
jgi:hypothetical protein